jgi:hypothetical protein
VDAPTQLVLPVSVLAASCENHQCRVIVTSDEDERVRLSEPQKQRDTVHPRVDIWFHSSNLSPSGDIWFRLVVERGDGVVNIVDASQAAVTGHLDSIHIIHTES